MASLDMSQTQTGSSSLFETVAELLTQMQSELAMVALAFCMHAVFFGKYRVGSGKPKAKKNKGLSPGETGSSKGAGAKPAEAHAKPATTGAHHVALIKRLVAEERFEEALSTIPSCPDKHTYLFNTLLDACVERKDSANAERVMAEAEKAGAADSVTYNTVLKARLLFGPPRKAQETVRAMRAAGLQPTCVTFNQLIDATIRSDIRGTWRLIDEMESCGVKPNNITASILLKSVQPGTKTSDIERSMAVVDAMKDKMDEVLLSSVIEACVRTERIDLLAKQLKKLGTAQNINPSSATTYGSILRAYGVLHDVGSAWALWRKMRAAGVSPTSITLGCMVETLVTNGEIEAGHQLVHETLADAETRSLVNAVIYCSIIKGFSHMKRFERAWEVYEEMMKEGLKPSRTVFNALLDSCARCGKMSRASSILEDMARHGCEPNLVTYSSIIKGYCVDKNLEAALTLFQHMKQEKGLCPDEVTWNTLLDGCARQGLCDRGMKLLNEMLESGIPPSNFTLSVVVKLLHRGRRLEEAFEICEKLSQKFRFKLNTYVYNNLIQACIGVKDLQRALATFEGMLREGSRPDSRTYTLLLQGCTSLGKSREAGLLLGSACGIAQCSHPRLVGLSTSVLKPTGGLPAEAVSEVLEALGRRAEGGDEASLAVKLFGELRKVMPGLRLSRFLSTKLASEGAR